MFKKISVMVALISAISLLCLPGCSGQSNNIIKIGAIYPLSGAQAEAGKDVQNGLLLAADIINNRYDMQLPLAATSGITSLNGAKIELVFADSQGLATVAKSEAQRLIEKENIAAIIGCYHSAVTAACSEVAEQKGLPFISDISTAPSLTERGYKWFFRTTPDDVTFIKIYIQFLAEMQQKKGTGIQNIGIVYENSLWGSEFAKYQKQYAEEAGYKVVANIGYRSDVTDVSSEVQKLKSANPDVVIQASYTRDAILLMQTYKQAGFNPKAILTIGGGFNDADFIKTLGEDSNYVYTRDLWAADWAETQVTAKSVNNLFKQRYGADMTSNSARAFTALSVLAEAINRAGSSEPEAIQSALLTTDLKGSDLIMPWDGVKFDPQTHQNTLAGSLICQIINKNFRVVWAGKQAAKEPVFPVPSWESR